MADIPEFHNFKVVLEGANRDIPARLKALAQRRGRSSSALIVHALERYLAEESAKDYWRERA